MVYCPELIANKHSKHRWYTVLNLLLTSTLGIDSIFYRKCKLQHFHYREETRRARMVGFHI